MSKPKFHINQRVRSIVEPVISAVAKGTLGTVVALEDIRATIPGNRMYLGYEVVWDGHDGTFQWPAKDMEPVWPGSEKCEWSECAWQPKRETA